MTLSQKLKENETKKTENQAPHLIIEARAGTGKTTTLIEGLKLVKGITPSLNPSSQQRAVWDSMELSKDAKTVCFVAFNKAIADELKQRVPEGCNACTMHSLGFAAIRKAFGSKLEVTSWRVTDIIGEILGKDPKELKRTRPTLLNATKKLVSLCKMNLIGIQPFSKKFDSEVCFNPLESKVSAVSWREKLEELSSHYDVDLNGDEREVFELVPKVLERCLDVAKDGRIDFDDMVWLPIALGLPVDVYDLLLCDESQDLNRCQQALAKQAGRRLIFCGDKNQCHPVGTLVTKTGGKQVPIETLKIGDQLVSYNPNQSHLSGSRTQGRKVEAIASREYEGDLYEINGTPCTPNHKWLTRFAENGRKLIAIYLMQLQDESFRIGQTQLMLAGSNGFGPGLRARQEGATRLWVLELFSNREEAREYEFKESIRFQIPQRAQYEISSDRWPKELIDEGVIPQADELLSKYDKLYDYPIWEPGEGKHIGRYPFVTQACNLFPDVNLIACRKNNRDVQWSLAEISISPGWSGKVYSLGVQPTEKGKRLYLANNNVVSNSIYGFAGADSESMNRLKEELSESEVGCEALPLTVTYRCGKAIVAEANKIVPEFHAHESNGEGSVTEYMLEPAENSRYSAYEADYRTHVKENDMILCRVNAPLVSECFKFIKAGNRANIQGRDIGQGLITTIKKLKAADLPELGEKLSDWLHKEQEKENRKRNPSDTRLIALQDRYDCLDCFMEDATTIDEVIKKIEDIFTDDKNTGCILLSSIHKSKGLESKRVFILQPKGSEIRHPMSKSDWQKEQNENLVYVAITRAIEELIWVS